MTETKPQTIKTKKILNVLREAALQPENRWCVSLEKYLDKAGIVAYDQDPKVGYCTCKSCSMVETKPERLTYRSGPLEIDKDQVAKILAKATWDQLTPNRGLGIALKLGVANRFKKAYAEVEAGLDEMEA